MLVVNSLWFSVVLFLLGWRQWQGWSVTLLYLSVLLCVIPVFLPCPLFLCFFLFSFPCVICLLLVLCFFLFQFVICPRLCFQEKVIRLKRGLQGIFFRIYERMIKDDLCSFQMHAFRIGKLCFLICEYAKWFLIIHAVKTQLWSYLMVFRLSFRFLGVRISLEFSELVY